MFPPLLTLRGRETSCGTAWASRSSSARRTGAREQTGAVGGAKASKHMEGIAFDIAMAAHYPEAFEAAARAIGFQGFRFYPRSGFMQSISGRRGAGARPPEAATAFAGRRRRRARCWPRAGR